MLKIHGVSRSRASRVVWLCHEIGLPFEQVPVIQANRLGNPMAADAPLNTLSAPFLQLSPAGAIPVIDDGGLVLSESLACTLHLARKAGAPIGPADEAELALMEQWSFYAATSVEPDATTILFLHDGGRGRTAEDEQLVLEAVTRLARPLRVLDSHLADNGYLVGRRFSVADLNMAEILRYAMGYASLLDPFPAVQAWLSACHARPAFKTMWQERAAEPE